MKIAAILALSIALAANCVACLNGETTVLKNGMFLYEDRQGKVPYGHNFFIENYTEAIKEFDSLYKATKDLDYLSDKGLLLILAKKYNDAINLYLKLEKIRPGRYSTASNLGTAYELAGQNENALKWIKKAVEIDPTSHYNSEWIHVNILEAKIKGPSYYTSSFLLETDFGSGIVPTTKLGKKKLEELSQALYYQLNERVSFVEPKEAIVAQLLFDLGNIAFLSGNFQDAKEDYDLAKKYGFDNPLIESRYKETELKLKSPAPGVSIAAMFDKRVNYLTYAFWAIGIAIVAIMGVTIYKRKKNSS